MAISSVEDGRAFLEERELSKVGRGIIEACMAAIDALKEQIRKLEPIQDVSEAGADTQLLMSIPGVSYFTS
jgi:transposase